MAGPARVRGALSTRLHCGRRVNPMRFLVEARIPTEPGNRAIDDPGFLQNIEGAAKALHAEAVYAHARDGERTITMVTNMDNASEMVAIAEPLFHMGVRVTFFPTMNLDDLKRGVTAWRATAKR